MLLDSWGSLHCEEMEMVSLEDARKVIAAAEKKAGALKQAMNIAVVDAGGNLVAHARTVERKTSWIV
jgi:uncharacterized protein GlcG (DUF336 family)